MYADDIPAIKIIDYLNSLNITTSTGTKWNRSSLHRMLCNRRYLGYYIFGDKETKGGMPKLMEEKLFNDVQKRLEKNKTAPARGKAKVDYILTTKLFCGKCLSPMTGVSGTSKTGDKHYLLPMH